MAKEGAASEVHPVLIREIVRRDGSRTLAFHVFCSRRTESVPLAMCETCAACLDISPDAEGVRAVVRCRPPCPTNAPTAFSRGDPNALPGDTTPVGTILHGATLCAGSDAEAATLLALLAERALPELFVVDESGRLVGLVRDGHLQRGASSLGDVMSSATCVEEAVSVRRAVVRMAGAHVRAVPIVTRDGLLVGVLRDVDGLHFIATDRRGRR